MFSNLDTTHSYDTFGMIADLYHYIFDKSGGLLDWFLSVISNLPFYLINFFAKYAVFSVLFSMAMIVVVIIYALKYRDVKIKILSKIIVAGSEDKSESNIEQKKNPKWDLVKEHIDSEDANKWKLAILEADIMLSELLDTLHLPGESIGEKLKAVETSDFTSIEEAWEAHKIRNAIAHQGSEFLITKREAKRIIGLYEKVFDEFGMV
ncbi:MAG: hypothetical protein WCG60_02865 [bacterium]|jgi:hypothetical protein